MKRSLVNYDREGEKIKIIDIRDNEGGVKRVTFEDYSTVSHKSMHCTSGSSL